MGYRTRLVGRVAEACSALWSLVDVNHILGLASYVAGSLVPWDISFGIDEVWVLIAYESSVKHFGASAILQINLCTPFAHAIVL